MKGKIGILWMVLLTAYLLCACTILSRKIEQEMMVEVRSETRLTKESGSSTSVGISAVFTDADGDHLYEIVDGTGWETGLRVREVPAARWTLGVNLNGLFYTRIAGGQDYSLIVSASRQPTVGEVVRIVETFETVADQYLVLYPDGVPDTTGLPSQFSILGRSDTALLMECGEGQLPFMPQTVKTSSVATDQAAGIISLTEAEQLLRALPFAAVAGAALIVGLVVWAASWCFILGAKKAGGMLWCSIAVMAASLAVLAFVQTQFDLPSSMLPPQNLLQWDYYFEEYGQILGELADMNLSSHPLISLCPDMLRLSARVLKSGLLLSLAVPLAELVILWVRSRFHRKQDSAIHSNAASADGAPEG